MTIETKTAMWASARDGGYRFGESFDVAVWSATGRRTGTGDTHSDMVQECLGLLAREYARWRPYIPMHRFVLFASTPFWSAPNAVERRKGVWRTDALSGIGVLATARSELEIRTGTGSRFAGLAVMPHDRLLESANYVRVHPGGALLLALQSDGPSQDDVSSCFVQAFPKGESRVNWESFIEQRSGRGDIVLRVSGAFDDREVAIDAFLPPDLASLLLAETRPA